MTMHSQIAAGPATGLAADAQLRTPCGSRRAEFIRPGDLIVTRTNGLQPVRMVWTRTVTESEITADPSLAPVCLSPRAIGPMMPQRRLTLAPAHRILVPSYMVADPGEGAGCLIEARELAGSSDAIHLQRDAAGVTFYNLVFDSHEIVLASGLPVETFHPSAKALDRVDGATRAELLSLFPNLRTRGEAFPAAAFRHVGADAYLPALA